MVTYTGSIKPHFYLSAVPYFIYDPKNSGGGKLFALSFGPELDHNAEYMAPGKLDIEFVDVRNFMLLLNSVFF